MSLMNHQGAKAPSFPDKIYLRRGEAFELLQAAGLTEYACRQLVELEVLKPVKLCGARKHFLTNDVRVIVEQRGAK